MAQLLAAMKDVIGHKRILGEKYLVRREIIKIVRECNSLDTGLPITDLFRQISGDKSKSLNREEVSDVLRKLVGDDAENLSDKIFEEICTEGQDMITVEQLLEAKVVQWVQSSISGKPERVRQLFDSIDEDGGGMLDWDDLQMYLRGMHGQEWIGGEEYKHIRNAFDAVDHNGHGTIDFEEFLHLWLTKEEFEAYAIAKVDDDDDDDGRSRILMLEPDRRLTKDELAMVKRKRILAQRGQSWWEAGLAPPEANQEEKRTHSFLLPPLPPCGCGD